MTEPGPEAGSSLHLPPSQANLRVLALRAGRAEVPGTKRCHASLTLVTRFEINRSLSSPGRGSGLREGEHILAEPWPEQRFPDPQSCCPVPCRTAEDGGRVRVAATPRGRGGSLSRESLQRGSGDPGVKELMTLMKTHWRRGPLYHPFPQFSLPR